MEQVHFKRSATDALLFLKPLATALDPTIAGYRLRTRFGSLSLNVPLIHLLKN